MTIERTWAMLLLTTGPWTLPAFAQTATSPTATPTPPAATTEARNDEIIVTANKRSERVRDVALSITAISGEELNARRLEDIQDLATRVPGFSFSRGGSGGPGQRIIIRGLNTGGPAGTVASVLDDVPLTASAQSSAGGEFAADFDPYDLDRVEVLKGPQGTLYGASSLGGLVKYVTKAPDTHDVHLGMDFGFTDLKHGGLGAFGKGYINLPIASDKAAFRASGYYEYQPGWIDNKLAGTTQTNDVHRYGGRASLLLKPVEDLTLRLTAVVQDRQSGGYDTVEVRGYLDNANPLALLNGYNKGTYVAEPNTAHSEIYAGNLDYDLGRLRLQSITSYAKLKTTYRYDNPFYAGLSSLFFGRANTTLSSESVNRVEKFSQELRLASNNSASANGHGLEYQLGFFYTRETSQSANTYLTRDIATGAPVITPASVAATPPGTPDVFLGDIGTKYREYAGYIDLTYHFSPRFDIEAGGRVFHNEQSFTQGTGGALFAPPTFTTVGPFSSSETRGTFAVAPRFHVNRNLILYARAASGYRPGGPNVAIPPALAPGDTPGLPPKSFGADTTVNYEGGIKGSALHNRLSFDVAGYYIDWSDIQVTTIYARGFTAYPATINSGKAVSTGFEWNLDLTPVRGLTLGWLGSYDEATLSGAVPQIAGTAGSQLPYVPRWSTTATIDYDYRVSNRVSAIVGGAYAYTGPRFTNFAFNPSQSYQRIPAYETWSAQAGLRFDDRVSVQIYGKNLTDERGITNYSRGQSIFGLAIPGTVTLIRPREIGLRFTGNF